ncbi:MAG TPA: hypothetical protein DDY71_13370 [Spirochaetia bacterium]|nr:hypothetical protein [Spirochaetia bacterium]HBI38626.1 hypothetical protein [Spirochaetia bacterium]
MMERSEIAEELNSVINLYTDFIKTGVNQPHTSYDFSNYTIEITTPEEQIISPPIQEHNTQPIIEQTNQTGKNGTMKMIDLSIEISRCKKCPLSQKAKKIIPGNGLVNTDIFILTNPVTPNEEKENYPLSGEEKEFFFKWLTAIGLNPEKIFITNLLKCNWTTNQLKIEFIEACRGYLDRQIDIVNPKIILTLGQLSLSSLKKAHADIMNERGRIIDYRGYKVFPIFDPGMVLKNPALKTIVWNDLKMFKSIIDNG